MKLFLVSFAVLVAAASAVPQPQVAALAAIPQPEDQDLDLSRDARFFDAAIGVVIENIKKSIKDPLVIESFYREFRIPLVNHAYVAIHQGRFVLEGLRDISYHVTYSLLTQRLHLDLILNSVRVSNEGSRVHLQLSDKAYDAEVGGSITYRGIRIVTDMRASLGINGLNIRDLSVDYSIQSIESNVVFVVLGNDHSEPLNEFLGSKLPAFLEKNREEINSALRDLLLHALNKALS